MSVIPDSSARARPQVPAADQLLQVLRHLSRQPGPVTARSIAASLALPRSTVYHLLATAQRHGFVVHLAEQQRWGLGTAAHELAGGYARQEPLARLGRGLVAGLSDRTGESAHLAVMSGRDVVYIVEERAAHRPGLVTDVGVRMPAHLTATGRAMLAALPARQLSAVFPNAESFTDRTGRGPGDLKALREVLRATRAAGFAVEDSEVTQGMRSVGVAVLDHNRWPVAALALTWPDRLDHDPSRLAVEVGDAARALAARLG